MNLPYHDDISERALIGSLILLGDKEERFAAMKELAPYGDELFLNVTHRHIFQGITESFKRHKAWDAVSIRSIIILHHLDDGMVTMGIVDALGAVPSYVSWRMYLANCIFSMILRSPHELTNKIGGFTKKQRNATETIEFLGYIKNNLEKQIELFKMALTNEAIRDMVSENYPSPSVVEQSDPSTGDCPI